MKFKDLLKWIADGSKNWEKGVQLYNHFGANTHLKRRFIRLGPIEFNKGLLREELTSIARMLEKSHQHKAVKSKPAGKSFEVKQSPVHDSIPSSQLLVETTQHLTVDLAVLPEALRKLHFKKGKLFNEASMLHKKLASSPLHERASMVETIVENMRENQVIWNEINFYQSNQKVKGEHPDLKQRKKEKELKSVPGEVLQRTLTNRRSNLSRYKKMIADNPADDARNKKRRQKIEEWMIEIKAIESTLKSHAVQ